MCYSLKDIHLSWSIDYIVKDPILIPKAQVFIHHFVWENKMEIAYGWSQNIGFYSNI